MNGAPEPLPDGPLVTWYGDDFTGATASMEVLAFAGLRSVLFFDPPTSERLRRFEGYRGIGIAGMARSKPPQWMDAHLPAVFDAMAGFGAPIAHYKICSTLDSSPNVGSIGRAAELAIPRLGGAWHPLVLAAPEIERYQAFGNLFAAVAGRPYRLDRHPVMSRHPVTPMDEADVNRHLARQTGLPMGLVDLLDLAADVDVALVRERAKGAEIVGIDCLDEATLKHVGGLIWRHRGERLFVIGSQGVEYALVAHWKAAELLDDVETPVNPGRAERMAVVSGSCSLVNANQISHAERAGFAAIRIDPARAVSQLAWEEELNRAIGAALRCFDEGRDPILFTASGPDDPAIAEFNSAIEASGRINSDVNAEVGIGLGRALRELIVRARLDRAVIAGGDTSSHGASALGIYALTALAPVAPGAPLCRAHSDDTDFDNLEIALKGGQMGGPDYFATVRNGGLAA